MRTTCQFPVKPGLFLSSGLLVFGFIFSFWSKIQSMSTDAGNFSSKHRSSDIQVILIFDSRHTIRYDECLRMMTQLQSKMSKSIHFRPIDISLVDLQTGVIADPPVPLIHLDSESTRVRLTDSQIFPKNAPISNKLIPVAIFPSKMSGAPAQSAFPQRPPSAPDYTGQFQSTFSFTQKLKQSHITNAFSNILSKLSPMYSTHPAQLKPQSEQGPRAYRNCSWILRVHSHSIPFNEVSYDFKDLLGWLNRRINRAPHRIKSLNHFYSVSNRYFAIIYLVHLSKPPSKARLKALKKRIVGNLKALSAEFPYTDFFYSTEESINQNLNIKMGHSLLVLRQFEDGHKTLFGHDELSFEEMRNMIRKFHFPFIMLWNKRVLDFILEERQDTAFLVIRKHKNFHLEAAFERVALMFRLPKVRFAVIPIEGRVVSPSKIKILRMLGISPESKFPAVYGLFFEKNALYPRENLLHNNNGNPLKLGLDSPQDKTGSELVGQKPKKGQFRRIEADLLELINHNSFPRIKVVKCENMTEKGLKSFLGSLNNRGGFAHCRQNQFISHKHNHRVINFLNLDLLESLFERSVHFQRIVLIYFSAQVDEKLVVSEYSKAIRKLKSHSRPSRPSRRRHRGRRAGAGKKASTGLNFESAEKQFYLFDKSRNEWPAKLKGIADGGFYLFSFQDTAKDKNVVEYIQFDSLDQLQGLLTDWAQQSARKSQIHFIL